MTSKQGHPGRASVSVAITGSGGAGVMTAGNMLLEAAAKAGWYGLMVRSSGPQIRGGEAAALLRLATHPVDSLDDVCDVLVAVDWQNIHRFADEIPLGAASVIVGDPDQGDPPEVYLASGARYGKLAMKATAKSIPGSWPNMVALGVAAGLVGVPLEAVKGVVASSLKKSDALAASITAVEAGMKAAAEFGDGTRLAPPPAKHDGHWLLTGNQAAGFGAIRAGVRFVAAYPITPATELLEYMAPALTQVGGVLVQAEDELASINMIIGASYGGVPALTATAGPGLSLMVEALGLAVAAEVPIVVVDVMRGGPSTGIPAKSEQSDLSLALHGLHGDAPRIVLAPNSIADCVTTTQWAVHLAEQMQVPAIVLSDQFFGQARAVVERPADAPYAAKRATVGANAQGYKRYALTDTGISPMSIPGTPGVTYTADGLEHNERGIPSSGATDHRKQLAKRERKLAQGDYARHWADLEGEGEIAVITFGSSTGPVREALARAKGDGVSARLVSLRLLAPAQPERLAAALAGVKRVLVVEQNHGGQLARYLRSDFEIPGEVRSFRQPGPLPIRPAALHREIVEWSRA
ncbi:MAG: 2-oxoacid:acceptor oxidoreductase subunit alpha [Burkholderiales bacterium]|nr:2-oxoacid:acceptor oxidoreductase subunit alpha [Burkholderiales bacterium]